jgi:hypothetical protein
LSAGGGIELRPFAVTDDVTRCVHLHAVGPSRTAPRAGLGIYERAVGGLLGIARLDDDIDPPAAHP